MKAKKNEIENITQESVADDSFIRMTDVNSRLFLLAYPNSQEQ